MQPQSKDCPATLLGSGARGALRTNVTAFVALMAGLFASAGCPGQIDTGNSSAVGQGGAAGGTPSSGSGGNGGRGTGGGMSGGVAGTGGRNGTGGGYGTGGAGTGGRGNGGGDATGTGGMAGSGGATGSGGAAGSGGATGSGGAAGSAQGTGGMAGSNGGAGTGGAGARDGGVGTDATFTALYATIFGTATCAGTLCHNPGIQKGVDLSTRANAYSSLKFEVVAGNSAGSALYKLLANGTMPPDPAPKLTATQVAAVAAWIDAGALDD